VQADLLLYNGAIYTLDPVRPYAQAVAISGNRIVAVGGNQELRQLLSPGGQTLDLQGQTVLPAFTDCHIHFLSYALRLTQIDLSGLTSRDAVLAQVAMRAAETPPDRWLQRGGWDRNLWPDAAFPTKEDLDRVAPRHPVALSSKCGHVLWASSRALELAGVTAHVPDPDGGEIARYPTTGEPTGILKEQAIELVRRVIPRPSPEEAEDAIARAVPRLHRVGLAGIHDCEGAEAFQAFQRLAARGELKGPWMRRSS
jgi:predicted amidohydrolase YtcJ